MLIYCAKCEAANSDQAPFCGECGHPLMALARRTPMPQASSPKKPEQTTKLGGLIDKVATVADEHDPAPARSLITIRGKPIWAALTLLAGALGGVALYLGSRAAGVATPTAQQIRSPQTRTGAGSNYSKVINAESIVANKISLVDQAGNTRVMLVGEIPGNEALAGIYVLNKKKAVVMALGLTDADGTGFYIFDRKGNTRVSILLGPSDDVVTISAVDPNGTRRAVMGLTKEAGGALMIFDKEGKPIWAAN